MASELPSIAFSSGRDTDQHFVLTELLVWTSEGTGPAHGRPQALPQLNLPLQAGADLRAPLRVLSSCRGSS